MGKYVKREDVLKKLKDVSKLADGKSSRAVIALLRSSLENIPYIVVEEEIKKNDKN
jgi:hypothetical protein